MKVCTLMLTVFLVVGISYQELLGQSIKQTSNQQVSRDLFSFKVTSAWKSGIIFHDFNQNTLSRAGVQLLINDCFGKGLFLLDVQASNKEPKKLSDEWYLVWFDSESDFVFGLRYRKPYPADRQKQLLDPKLEMCCFKDTKKLIENVPMWTSMAVGPVRWFESSKRFVRINGEILKPPSDGPSSVDVFDEKGEDLKSFNLPGNVLGVDEDDEGMQIIYYVGKGRNTIIHAASLSWALEEKKKVKLGSFPFAHVLQNQTDVRRLPAGTRFIRVRDLQKGDVLGYFRDICANPSFMYFADYQSLPNNPLNQLTLQHRKNLGSRGGWWPINQRSAAEDAQSFEFFSASSVNEVCFLANHQGAMITYEFGNIHDAVRIENRWLFIRTREGTPTRDLILTQVEMPEASDDDR
ncbi:MAG: hypothetical protein U0930_26550 [Pirellulales bacterium]